MIHAVLHELANVFTWPMSTGKHGGYNFWSGIGSGSPLLVGIAVYWRHHNCHIQRCWRLSWHPDPQTGHPICRRHHPDHPSAPRRRYRRRREA